MNEMENNKNKEKIKLSNWLRHPILGLSNNNLKSYINFLVKGGESALVVEWLRHLPNKQDLKRYPSSNLGQGASKS